MEKNSLIGFMLALTLVLTAADAKAADQMVNSLGRAFSANHMIGVDVKSPKGEVLGRITDLVVDSEGRISLVILAHGGFLGFNQKATAIPFSALKYGQTEGLTRFDQTEGLILDTSKEKLASAPVFRMSDLLDRKEAEDFYRYFGQQPYWSEGGEPFKGFDEPLEEMPPERSPFPLYGPYGP